MLPRIPRTSPTTHMPPSALKVVTCGRKVLILHYPLSKYHINQKSQPASPVTDSAPHPPLQKAAVSHSPLMHIAIPAPTAPANSTNPSCSYLLVHVQNVSSSNCALLHQLIHIIQLAESNNFERGIDESACVKVEGFRGILNTTMISPALFHTFHSSHKHHKNLPSGYQHNCP